LQLSVPRAVFGSPFARVSWARLSKYVRPIPEPMQQAADKVLAELGLSEQLMPRDALARLVNHFRSFKPSEELPGAESGVELYTELTLSQKGVCRHRGYAFVITALALGLPARFVRNEAHAWVEVYDGELWHRIDLGGAASQLQSEQDTRVAPHHAPDDPFEWPDGSESALDMASQAATQNSQGAPPGTVSADQPSQGDVTREAQSGSETGLESSTESESAEEAAPEEGASDRRPKTLIDFDFAETSTRRGAALRLQGTARAANEPCAFARVDVVLEPKDGQSVTIGSLPTDEVGHFTGSVTVPLSIDVGHYVLTLTTPGTAACGPSAFVDEQQGR
ncbi:MAG TPA: transglutaminase-like domain-containing protein, partial [Polyangiaceae bacterium]|nr:transglutaminase-like domain-containing protein [Polyangiaceae bacterium]